MIDLRTRSPTSLPNCLQRIFEQFYHAPTSQCVLGLAVVQAMLSVSIDFDYFPRVLRLTALPSLAVNPMRFAQRRDIRARATQQGRELHNVQPTKPTTAKNLILTLDRAWLLTKTLPAVSPLLSAHCVPFREEQDRQHLHKREYK